MSSNTISIVIPNLNGWHYLGPCLDSIARQSLPGVSIEIIVVDNASTDGSRESLTEKYPSVHVVANITNLGFCAAVNQGAEQANGAWLLILNNDTELAADSLARLHSLLASSPSDVIAVQPLLLSASDPDRIDSAGIAIGPRFRARDRMHRQPRSDAPTFPAEIWGACAACMLVRRSVFDEVGGLDPSYFAELDDVDFALRVRWHGYRFLLVPDAIVYHHRSPTQKRLPGEQTQRHLRNFLFTAAKCLPAPRSWLLVLYRFQRDLFMIPHSLRTGQLLYVCAAWREFFASLARVRRKRAALLTHARLTPRQMQAQLRQFQEQTD